MKISKATVPFAVAGLLFSVIHSAQARTEIQNKGSDTLVNVAQAWAEEYGKIKPDVAVAVSGGGSGTGIAAMINGTVDIANASRKMKGKEVKLAEEMARSRSSTWWAMTPLRYSSTMTIRPRP